MNLLCTYFESIRMRVRVVFYFPSVFFFSSVDNPRMALHRQPKKNANVNMCMLTFDMHIPITCPTNDTCML